MLFPSHMHTMQLMDEIKRLYRDIKQTKMVLRQYK